VLSKPVDSKVFRFANIYGDHMVLQQAPFRANVWGFGEVGQPVVVIIGNLAYQVKVVAGPQGKGMWTANLDAHKGGPYSITASSKVNSTLYNITLNNVLFGDVWICSGQSNMQFSIAQVINMSEAVKEAENYPNIRLFTAFQVQSDIPLYELSVVQQPWSVASSASVNGGVWKYFSAVCWFYAKNLYDKYKHPLGMIATDWGGTPVEAWSSPDALATCNITDLIPRKVLPEEEIFAPPNPSKPSVLYNAMIHPLLKMTVFGAIWYQGEANAGVPNNYNCTFPAMIDDWRQKWYTSTGGHTDPLFAFGFVQLSSYGDDPTVIGGFPVIRWAQTANYGYVPNARMRNVFMAVSMDLGNASSPWGSIHPNDKQDVGYRLALSGRAIAYSESGVYYTGPLAVKIMISLQSMPRTWLFEVLYSDVGAEGIEIRARSGFEFVCESNGVTSDWIEAQILTSSFAEVDLLGLCPSGTDRPTGIRYAWRQDPCTFKTCAVYSKTEGLPSPPFVKYAPF
ncbi:hypothetical protein QZH41_013585, partial [Actinostola sp. cb2023]